MKHNALVCLLLLTAATVIAQPPPDSSPWNQYRHTIRDLVNTALKENPRLLSQNAAIQAARTGEPRQRGLPPPMITAEYMQSTTMAQMRDMEYSVEQMFMFPGRQRAMRIAESLRPGMARQDSIALARSIATEVMYALNEMFLSDRLADVNMETISVLRNLISSLRSKYETGSSGRQPLLRAEAALFKTQSDSAELAGKRAGMQAMIGTLMGDTTHRSIPLIADFSLPPVNPGDVETFVATALRNRPEISSMETKIMMDSLMLRGASASLAPDMTVRASYRDVLGEPEDVVGVMLGITLPAAPWSLGRSNAEVSLARAGLLASRADLWNMKSMIRAEVTGAHARLVTALLCCTRFETASIDKSEDALQASLSEYRTGMGPFSMVLDDLKMKLMAQEDYYMAKMELLNAMAELDKATGTPTDSSIFFGGAQ